RPLGQMAQDDGVKKPWFIQEQDEGHDAWLGGLRLAKEALQPRPEFHGIPPCERVAETTALSLSYAVPGVDTTSHEPDSGEYPVSPPQATSYLKPGRAN